MKYIPSIAFEEMSGSAKGVTAAKVRGRKYIRNRGYGGGFKSSAQGAVKSILGTSSKITGANLYSRLNFWIVKCGGTALSEPPVLEGVEAPSNATVVLTPTTFTFTLDSEPENIKDLKLVIMASAPQSNGVTNAYSKAVQIGEPREAVSEEFDLKADFDSKNGVPTTAAPKVFIKYFYVNAATGEKSGEMLVQATLASDI